MEELIERLKHFPLSIRVTVAAILGVVIPWYFMFWDDVNNINYELEMANGKYESIEGKFNRAKRQKTDMPELEKKIEFTRQELLKAKTKLPDNYQMDSILEFVATASDEAGAELLKFEPNEEAFKDTGYSYVEMPIQLSVQGTYNQIGVFFDKLVHMEKMIHLRDMNSQQVVNVAEPALANEMTQQARLAAQLDGIKVKTDAKLIVFRSARPGEGAGADPVE